MMELIQSDDLCAEEEEVYESTMMWLKYNLDERLKYLPELIKSIRLSIMSVDYLDSTVQEEELIQSDIKCMRCLFHAYKVHRQIKTMDNGLVLANNNTRRKFTRLLDNPGEDFIDNFSSIETFLNFKTSIEFSSLKFEQMMKLIKSDDLCAEELQVFEATIAWIKYDEKNRCELFPELFLSIRLSIMQVKDLANIVECEELVSSNSICMDFLLDTYRMLTLDKIGLTKPSKYYSQFNIFNHRNHNLNQVLVTYRKSCLSKIEWFDKINNATHECSLTWPSDSTTSNLILTDGRIFSMSCSDGVNSVKLYDGHLKIWKSINTPVFVHIQSYIIQFYDQVYVISTSGVEYYDILKETWQEVKFKISGISDLKLAVVSDLIYGVCREKAFYYDPKTDFGQLICPLKADVRHIYSICSFNNQLWMIGYSSVRSISTNRYTNNIIINKYNQQLNVWHKVQGLANLSISPGVIVLNGILYLIGGQDYNKIIFYDPKLVKSYYAADLKSSLHSNTQAFVIDTKSMKQKNILKYYSNNEI